MKTIEPALEQAAASGALLKTTLQNILLFLNRPDCEEWERASLAELVEAGEWSELNDRFYRTLEFGTGGLRGRTIGKIVTRAEQGSGSPQVPQYPAAGTNTMNFFTVKMAAAGLMNYLAGQFPNQAVSVAISCDPRFFSREFSRLAASIISAQGGVAHMFADVRPTPELSFAVRALRGHAGIMVTASHNPPHDNGFKVYDANGAQVVEPQASAIIRAVAAVQEGGSSIRASAAPGQIESIEPGVEDSYIAALKGLVLRPDVMNQQSRSLKVVYTPIHGTGATIIPRLLREAGVDALVVSEQAVCDGRFPTVRSPNPENPEALSLAVKLAAESGADAVIATDPDCDRMGVAVRNSAGEYKYLTGNQIGSVMAHYRLEQLFAQGILTPRNANHAAIIKTLVTTDLLRSIAAARGVRCVETLTGFKHIANKLRLYEESAGGRGNLSASEWRSVLLEKSAYNVLSAEESYGYLAEDFVRDKDAAGSTLMFVELLAFARQNHLTAIDLLDRIYLEHGYHGDRLGTLTFEGEEGAGKISTLLASYDADPPLEWAGKRVVEIQNYATGHHTDIDGTPIPHELMLTFRLADGCSVTTRASGTEPKIKFYLSAAEPVTSAATLGAARRRIDELLESFWRFTQADVDRRVQALPVK